MNARGARLALLILAAAALAAPAQVLAAGEQVPRSVVSAGATSAAGPGLQLVGTLGQLAVGASAGASLGAGHGFWAFAALPTLGVDPTGGPHAAPGAIEFGVPMPNPSRTSIAFDIGLPRAGQVELRIVDVQGRNVATPAMRTLAAGRHRLMFTPAGGAAASPGVYFARLSVDGCVAGTRRFVRIR